MYRVSNSLLSRLLLHFAQTEQFAFFDTSRPDRDNSTSYLFENPVARLQCGIQDHAGDFLAAVQKWLDKEYYIAGWVGYEFGGLLCERTSGLTSRPEESGRIVADLGVYPKPSQFDHLTGDGEFGVADLPIQEMAKYKITGLQANIDKQTYLKALQRVLEYIRAGDTYQVNFTLKLLFDLVGSPEALYRDLRRNQSVSYGAYLRWGNERVMSFSPELFFKKNAHQLIAKPMKGTLKRGRDAIEDDVACDFLRHDSKNRSENVMIVDLLRNDLGRVLHEAGGGEVRVDSLFDVEPYESLLQMTSTVKGSDRSGKLGSITLEALFRALFPCGSVTGAPKIRTMEIIAELELENRGVYTGAIGFIAPDGDAVFNVPIRTLVLDGGMGEMGIGSGITHDSDPQEEWQECLLKGNFLTSPAPDFELFETMLWQPEGGYWLLDEHLQRLASSAAYYYYYNPREMIEDELQRLAIHWSETQRVRVSLAKDGTFSISTKSCNPPTHITLPGIPDPEHNDLPVVKFSQFSINSQNSWCMHKTSHRDLYNSEYGKALEEGLFDMLFVNEKGEVTEGAITNICIYRDGKYLTPPLRCGLLAGVMRGRLLGDMGIKLSEQVLLPEDLYTAEAVYLTNSVRGVVRVRVLR